MLPKYGGGGKLPRVVLKEGGGNIPICGALEEVCDSEVDKEGGGGNNAAPLPSEGGGGREDMFDRLGGGGSI